MSVRDAVVVNAGSTSIKLSRFVGGREVDPPGSLDDALADGRRPPVVVHRVVHGGHRSAAVLLDDDIVAELRSLTELAPLHQPPALDAIERCRQTWPDATQVACFDTAFHATLPASARTYALPQRLRDLVRVYGFHGLSHSWASSQVASVAPAARRVLVAHLGGGQSLCGVRDGASVVTTMGFTPLDGLVMATRCGAIDPGALLWLAKHTDEDLEAVLDRESGLQGLAGTSDMKAVEVRAAAGDEAATLALEVWLHRFLQQAGGCIAVLGGVDALVFTGGVGEHSAPVRAMVAQRLAWLGVAVLPAGDSGAASALPDADNATVIAAEGDGPVTEISAAGAGVRTFVVHAREDLQMLDEAGALLQAGRR